jgi:hypothetical protein
LKKLLAVAIAASALVAAAIPQPAPAVIHEIYAAWCAGKGEIEPPGISIEGSKNFAAPVNAGGVVTVHPFTGSAGPGLLIDFDFDSPQAKIVPTGEILVIGSTPAGPLYIEDFVIDPNFPAFSRCAQLQVPG